MKLTLRFLCLAVLFLLAKVSPAQCTQAQLNWDQLSYYTNAASSSVSTAMETKQKFAIGPNYVTFDVTASGVAAPGVAKGDNASHTGDVAGYTGEDAQFTPTVALQTITLTFANTVTDPSFTLYDVDRSQVLTINAKDASGTELTKTVTTYTSTILSQTGSGSSGPALPVVLTANSTTLGNTSNQGTATIAVTGTTKTIVITVTTLGSDPTFWLSDINACVTGSFPTNYHSMPSEKPFTGQPSYIIGTPDNNSAYMIDVATGKSWYLFNDPAKQYINSFAYDQVHHILYYISENSSPSSSDKTLKKYDFNTETISTVLSDITATLNIPVFTYGVESAGAAFYDGALYLGIEGPTTAKSIIFRIDFDPTTLVPNNAYQVNATAKTVGGNAVFDWGDFMVENGKIINFNGAYAGTPPSRTYTYSSFIHYDMMTGAATTYTNPVSTQMYASQGGIAWNGDIYSFWWDANNSTGGVRKYNMDGTLGTNNSITVVNGPAWPGGAGDASDPFKPKVDFGDAPASYDPATGDPAVHAIDSNIYIGSRFDKEFLTRGQTALANSDNYDDGLSTVPLFISSSASYLATVPVMNKTGANATVAAWLDFDGDGVFEPSEGITKTVPSSASSQNVNLFWPSPTAYSTLQTGAYIYLRIRITYASNNMTVNNPTGYFSAGEVEDYRVPVNSYPLATTLHTFDATLDASKNVQLKWDIEDESTIDSYGIEKSNDGKKWDLVTGLKPKNGAGLVNYATTDDRPLPGTSYYRLRIIRKDGNTQFSDTKKIEINLTSPILIAPNPAIDKASVYVNSNIRKQATLQIINAQGAVVHNQNVTLNAGANTIELPVATKLNSGRYLVRIITDQNTISQSLIVNK
jgi:hypothetical protein